MNSPDLTLTLHFPGAWLHAADPVPHDKTRPRIAWFLLNVDINSASTRYRCFHFARALSDCYDSIYLTRLDDLREQIDTIDAIIVVKRLDQAIREVVSLADRRRKPVFLDLCDDVAHPLYPGRDAQGVEIVTLRAIAPALAGIVVPSAEMANRVADYLAADGLQACHCHVIPDIAETSELFIATARFVTGNSPPSLASISRDLSVGKAASNAGQGPKQVVWFGNFGATHSNFGMFSLKAWLRTLREYHAEVPLELVVVSNSLPVFNALVDRCGFPTRYVPWSGANVYRELQQADVALLTTGTDEFCTVKSSNRVIQALACGVPVIADKSTSLSEFEDVVLSGNMRRCLDICLRPENEPQRRARLEAANRILDRYTPEALAQSWSVLLLRAVGRTPVRASKRPRSGALLVAGPGDRLDELLAAIETMNAAPGFAYDLLMSTKLLETEPRFAQALHRARTLPRFYTDNIRNLQAMIADREYVFFGDSDLERGRMLCELARAAGVEPAEYRTVSHHDLGAAEDQRPSLDVAPRKPPGPYPEHTYPDGSVEWAFVIHSNARGWILDAICQEIGSRQPNPWRVIEHSSPPPPARNLFFSHFSLLEVFAARYPAALAASRAFLWYTHPREETPASIARSLELFGQTAKVIFTCEANRALWIARGLAPERTAVVLGAADPAAFLGHVRGGGCVGLSSSFYERKNPDLLLEIVKALPHRQFTLLGRHWNRYARFEQLNSMSNFAYLSAPYHDYPRIYSTFDVFLSLSRLEGGPIPLVEAMMANAVPVASNTGFAPDIISHGDNGFLFEDGAEPAEVAELIERAFSLTSDVRSTVVKFGWDQFSAQIMELAQ